MPSTGNQIIDRIVYGLVAAVLLLIGYQIGRVIGNWRASRAIARKEQELFTTQKGFRTLYEQDISKLKEENAKLAEQVKLMSQRVEEYRKKAAGFGGLFTSGGKNADAMYALLLENEALEEALYAQNEKLRQERTDSLKEQMRATGYRRVLMSQLLNDERIKEYVKEIMEDHKALPAGGHDGANAQKTALPQAGQSAPVQGEHASE